MPAYDSVYQCMPVCLKHTQPMRNLLLAYVRRQLNQIDNEIEPNIEEQADLLRLEQT